MPELRTPLPGLGAPGSWRQHTVGEAPQHWHGLLHSCKRSVHSHVPRPLLHLSHAAAQSKASWAGTYCIPGKEMVTVCWSPGPVQLTEEHSRTQGRPRHREHSSMKLKEKLSEMKKALHYHSKQMGS